jgi:hypothetical protein
MELSVAQGGKFSFTIKSKELSHGLRPSKSNPRDNDYLITCIGAYGKNNVLQASEELVRIATDIITDGFPFPQIFAFVNVIIVCGMRKIYEWKGEALELKYTATENGSFWTAVDFYDYIYLSNGKVAVVRNANNFNYTKSTILPVASAMCNFNGQVIVGAPGVIVGTEFSVDADYIGVSVSQYGLWS